MKLALLTMGVMCMLAGPASAEDKASPAQRTFQKLAGLTGEWAGTLEWSGSRTGTGEVRASYSMTANDSVVIENLFMGDGQSPSMTSAYHMDGPDLRMTHYCGAQNQPRLRATQFDEAKGIVRFAFVDATNLSVRPAHVDALELRFVNVDQVQIRFSFVSGSGAAAVENINLKRVHHK